MHSATLLIDRSEFVSNLLDKFALEDCLSFMLSTRLVHCIVQERTCIGALLWVIDHLLDVRWVAGTAQCPCFNCQVRLFGSGVVNPEPGRGLLCYSMKIAFSHLGLPSVRIPSPGCPRLWRFHVDAPCAQKHSASLLPRNGLGPGPSRGGGHRENHCSKNTF